jgi:Siphovirus Gp157
MANKMLHPDIVRQQIANLRLLHPEIAEDQDAWLISLESETQLGELLRMIERHRQDACGLAGALAGTIAELEYRQGRFERREQAMRELMFKLMQAAELKRFELPEATLSIAAGQPKVVITNEAAVLAVDDLCRIKREPNKTHIKTLLAAGHSVAGAELSNAEPHIVVRVR